MKKVLIGTPIYSGKKYCWEQWKSHVRKLKGDFDLLLVDNSVPPDFLSVSNFTNIFSKLMWKYIVQEPSKTPRETLAESQNVIVDYAMENGYSHILFLEQDIFPHIDVLNDLLIHSKLVVGFPYFKYLPDNKSDYIVWSDTFIDLSGNVIAEITPVDEVMRKFDGNLKRVFGIGMGCVLVDVRVFESGIRFRVAPNEAPFSDTYFSQDLFKRNIPFFADTSKIVKHLDTDFINNLKPKP